MTRRIENNPVNSAGDPSNAFVTMPVPHRFVPQVTSLLATLYAGESAGAAIAAPLPTSASPEPTMGPDIGQRVADEDDPKGLRTWTGAHPVWTGDLYASLINKGAISSDRMIAFMDYLPTGHGSASEIPALADAITAGGASISAEDINVALRWFGKFTSKAFPDVKGHVWPFEVHSQYYPKGYTGSRRLLFWFEPEQAKAWRTARA